VPEHEVSGAATSLTILSCGYQASCSATRCVRRATLILRKAEGSGRFLRQIAVCDEHGAAIAQRERASGLEILDRR
jgi:hypothetical protein